MNLSNYRPLELVGRVSRTRLQEGENFNWITWKLTEAWICPRFVSWLQGISLAHITTKIKSIYTRLFWTMWRTEMHWMHWICISLDNNMITRMHTNSLSLTTSPISIPDILLGLGERIPHPIYDMSEQMCKKQSLWCSHSIFGCSYNFPGWNPWMMTCCRR